ncbi:MAG: MATE family efflux transporter, partial [Phocaeicola sp.]
MKETKEGIDFGKGKISSLFCKMLLPTLLGMLFTAVFTITDGIFVGWGIGSEALAAINIVAPIFLLSTGVGLMFGMGGSVVASIHLSNNKRKAACITMTQSMATSCLMISLLLALVISFPKESSYMLGCSEELLPLAVSYIYGAMPFLGIYTIMCVAGFFIRLSGAPNYAMTCSIVAAVINTVLDYLFIFVLNMGIFGAGIATGIGTTVGVIMMLVFLFKKSNLLHFVSLKLSKNSFIYTMRNISYICKLGSSSLLCELAIAVMMICGNYMFMRYLGEDGVAAFSVACYFFPIIFMIYASIAQSIQPIISFNHGLGDSIRVKRSLSIALKTALAVGSFMILFTLFFSAQIVNMFINTANPVHVIATKGMPLFALGFLPFAINMISI